MKTFKPALKLKSAVCGTEVMVIRAAGVQGTLTCGGVEMLAAGDSAPEGARLDPAQAGSSLIGKRYVDAADRIELLCTKGGEGSLALDGAPLEIKQAKALPSSD